MHYNLHIMLRFDLERALIAGDLAVNDLEAAWNDRFAADFGMAVDRPRNGVLAGRALARWACSGISRPTASAMSTPAACMRRCGTRCRGLDDHLARGDVAPALAWLGETLQRTAVCGCPRGHDRACYRCRGGRGAFCWSIFEAKYEALYAL